MYPTPSIMAVDEYHGHLLRWKKVMALEFLKFFPKDVNILFPLLAYPTSFTLLYICNLPSLEIENDLEVNFSLLLLAEDKSPLYSLYLVLLLAP